MHSSDSASSAGLHHRGLRAPRWLRCGCAIASLATSASLAHPVLPEAATLDAINDARLAQGLGPLAPAPLLAELARGHSQRMAREQRLTHDGFDDRRRRAGAGACVENVALGYSAAAPLVAAWLATAGHRRNLLAPHVRHAAVAAEGRYVTFLACD
jgi:hypothetical protein